MDNKKKEIIAKEIISFCADYGVMLNDKDIKRKIELCLSEAHLIEYVIGMIFIKAKRNRNIDIEKVKELLIELEKVRLEYEFKDHFTEQNVGKKLTRKAA